MPTPGAGPSPSPCWRTGTASGSPGSARAHPRRRRVRPTSIIPYAYRHTYAQRHADAGVPIDVLAELLDHRNLNVTRRYYRVEEDRRRAAVDTVTALSFDRHGNRIWRDAPHCWNPSTPDTRSGRSPSPTARCTEPSNVQAGGGACPVRFRCAGCDHFRTDVSHLPELTAYLDDLLRTRERLAATIDGVDEWARADATPTERGDHPDPAADQPDQRRHRRAPPSPSEPRSTTPSPWCAVTAPPTPSARHAHRPGRRTRAADHAPRRPPHDTHHDQRPRPRRRARGPRRWPTVGSADSARRRQRVIAALNHAAAEGAEISVSGIARAAAVDRSFLYRHRDLLAQDPRPRRRTARRARPPARRSPGPRCRPTCSPPTNAPPGSTPASSTSRNACPKRSASTPGASPGSAPPPTSTPSTSRSPTSNSRPSTCACNWPNATRTSPPPAPPTAN